MAMKHSQMRKRREEKRREEKTHKTKANIEMKKLNNNQIVKFYADSCCFEEFMVKIDLSGHKMDLPQRFAVWQFRIWLKNSSTYQWIDEFGVPFVLSLFPSASLITAICLINRTSVLFTVLFILLGITQLVAICVLIVPCYHNYVYDLASALRYEFEKKKNMEKLK